MYGKIFDSMYEGTLYGHWQAIVTLQQMLVLCNSAGVLDMTPQAISARTSIPLEIITKGIEVLSAPDPYTRTPGEEGRRIGLLEAHRPWGWYIINYTKYQQLKSHEEKLEADRLRIAEKRKANKNNDVAASRKESQPVADVAYVPEAVPVPESEPKSETAPPSKKGNGENPPVTKAGMWAIELRKLNVQTTSMHPTMLKLIEDGFELPAVIEALEVARQRKPFPELIPVGYLDPIVRKPPKAAQKSWWASESGTLAKGRELGIEARPGEDMDAYRDRIRTSAHA